MQKVQNKSTKDDAPIQELPRACCDETAAVEFLEKHRWGDYPACPKCGDMDVYQMQDKDGGRQKNYRWRCHGCNAQYTVRVGTVFEDSRAPLRHWCFAFWRASTSKKGVSALEIHRQTGLSYKSSLFMLHRIRYAMAPDPTPESGGPLNGIVEVDETFVGGKPRKHRSPRKAWSKKQPVMAMVERGGRAKALVVPDVTAKTLKTAIRESVDQKAWIHTDEHKGYTGLIDEFGDHQTVNHSSKEYVRDGVTTNTVEGFFSIVKRGLNGIYHSVSKKHLQLYMNEYSFRYNHRALDDGERVVAAIRATEGKKLYYKEPVKV